MKKIDPIDLVVFMIFAVCGLIPPAAIIGRHFYGIDPLLWLHIDWGRTVLGYLALFLASLVCLLNFYLSIYVPWAYEREHGSMADFAHSSGLPVIGSFLVFCAGALLPASPPLGVFLLAIYLLDGNGLPCILLSLIRNGW